MIIQRVVFGGNYTTAFNNTAIAGLTATTGLLSTTEINPQWTDLSTTPTGSDPAGIYNNGSAGSPNLNRPYYIPGVACTVSFTINADIIGCTAITSTLTFKVYRTDVNGAQQGAVVLSYAQLTTIGTTVNRIHSGTVALDNTANQKGITIRVQNSSSGSTRMPKIALSATTYNQFSY